MNASPTTINSGSAVLWASVFIILALIILQAGRLPENAAHAHMTAERGAYSAMTAHSGRGRDANPYELLYVIDSREQVLLVYEIEDARRRQVLLRAGYNLEEQFLRARQ